MLHFDRELLRLLPPVLRARDFRLYLEGGKRLVDLWLQGGRAILGHKPSGVLGELKNAAERGLFSSLPHPMEGRFIKALGQFFPGRAFRLYLDSGALQRALELAGYAVDSEAGKGQVSLWRPFLEGQTEAPIMIPVLPWPLGPEVLVLEKGLGDSFPAGDLVPPVLLAPATRALYSLAAALKEGGQGRQRYGKLEKALTDSPWRRRGIYLRLESEMKMGEYESLFRRFLEGGFLLPPSPGETAILPAFMSKGEESKLVELIKA